MGINQLYDTCRMVILGKKSVKLSFLNNADDFR